LRPQRDVPCMIRIALEASHSLCTVLLPSGLCQPVANRSYQEFITTNQTSCQKNGHKTAREYKEVHWRGKRQRSEGRCGGRRAMGIFSVDSKWSV